MNKLNNEIILKNENFFFLKKKLKLFVFKTSVGLKRFNKKYTKFKRKAFNRIKHLKNWSLYHNVFNSWSKDYLFFKYYTKFQFINNLFINNYLFYNFNFIINLNPQIFFNWDFHFFNLTRKFNKYFHTYNSNYIYPLSYAWYKQNPKIDSLQTPLYLVKNSLYYPLLSNNKHKHYNFLNFFYVFNLININKIKQTRKLLTLLFLSKIIN